MKINYENKKPIFEDSSSEDEKPKNKSKNKNQDMSSDVFLSTEPSLNIFKKRPGTIINPPIKNRFVSKKDVTKNLKGLKKEMIETTILSNRFKFDENDYKNQQKKLDNSFEDYFLYAIVDEDSFIKFKNIVREYISKRLYDKTNKLYINLRKQISETIAKNINHIHLHYELIKKIENQYLAQKIKEKGCIESLCSCFYKKKKKNKLTRNYDMKGDALKVTLGLAGLVDELRNNFDEKSIENICPVPMEESKKFCDEKAQKFLEKKGLEERLREEVEFYSKFFKIESIIEKQKNTLMFQEEKKKKINEIRELNVCIICMEFQRNIMFTPCYHLSCCEKCATEAVKDECPECKKKIEDKIDVNFM